MTPVDAPSPNFDARVRPPDMIVMHYTGMPTGAAALERLRDPAAKVSAHYLVEEDGRVFALVPEARRAWHAGVSSWGGETDVNGLSVGVEIVNPGHEFGYRDFPNGQIAAVIDLVADIRSRWTIPDARIVGHSDVAPARKTDPGERFPWKALASAGHGLWAEPPAAPGPVLREGDEGVGVSLLQSALASFGYAIAPAGRFDTDTALTVQAFQRHFAPHRVDGVADGETRARLMAILRLANAA